MAKNVSWIQFSRTEQWALILFCVILFGVVLIKISAHEKQIPLEITFQKLSWEETIQSDSFFRQKSPSPEVTRQKDGDLVLNLFLFDPNRISSDSILLLGIPEKVAKNWIKYREKGGRFFRKDQLRKIYGMTPDLYDELSEYLVFSQVSHSESGLPKAQIKPPDTINTWKKPVYVGVDINQADQIAFEALPGIGPVLAKRIVKYRDALGGFNSLEQLHEVFGMSPETLSMLDTLLLLNTPNWKKIPINVATFKELLQHPYSDYDMTKVLIQYRDQHKGISESSQLDQIYLLDRQKLAKLLPYLDFLTVPTDSIQHKR